MQLSIKVLLLTPILLGVYWSILLLTELNVQHAESNYVANELRLQSLDFDDRLINRLYVGSSITARLTLDPRGDKLRRDVNLGLDAGSSLFGSKYLLRNGKFPGILIFEMNRVDKSTLPNESKLLEGVDSGTYRLAKYFSLVRAESRPVTIIYDFLKGAKDTGDENEGRLV